MAFWDGLLSWRRKDATAISPTSWFVDWMRGGEPTLSGISVTPESAMRHAAVWSCIRIRSEDIAKLPVILYRRMPGGGKERATEHPLYTLMHDTPNPRMTAFEFKQVMQAQLDLRGNAYALKDFDARGRVTALWPVNPMKVTVLATPDLRDLFYKIHLPNGEYSETIPAEGMLHIRGETLDGIVGLSPIAYHRETIGLGVAAEKYGAAFFGNSAQPRGAIKVPGIAQATAMALREDWEKRYRGVENSNRIAILDGGMEWVQTGMSNVDAQYIDLRKMQNEEIWRIYRIPPHKAGDLSRSTFSNIEHQALEYVIDCLMTEFQRWEQTLARDLLTTADRREYFFEFLPDALLRADIKSRYDAYAVARQWGWMSANDIRERDNMNKIPNGDIYLEPLNMIEAGKPHPVAGNAPAGTDTPPEFSAGRGLSGGARAALLRAAAELIERQELDDKAPKPPNGSGL